MNDDAVPLRTKTTQLLADRHCPWANCSVAAQLCQGLCRVLVVRRQCQPVADDPHNVLPVGHGAHADVAAGQCFAGGGVSMRRHDECIKGNPATYLVGSNTSYQPPGLPPPPPPAGTPQVSRSVASWRAVSGWFHMAVFMLGATRMRLGQNVSSLSAATANGTVSQARMTHVSSESQRPAVTLASRLADMGATTSRSAQRRSSMCRMGAPRVQAGCHSSSSPQWTPSTLGMARSDATVGCSADWPARKRAALGVSRMRIDKLGTRANAAAMSGTLMVATEPWWWLDQDVQNAKMPECQNADAPLAASNRCFFPSCSAAATAAAGDRPLAFGAVCDVAMVCHGRELREATDVRLGDNDLYAGRE